MAATAAGLWYKAQWLWSPGTSPLPDENDHTCSCCWTGQSADLSWPVTHCQRRQGQPLAAGYAATSAMCTCSCPPPHKFPQHCLPPRRQNQPPPRPLPLFQADNSKRFAVQRCPPGCGWWLLLLPPAPLAPAAALRPGPLDDVPSPIPPRPAGSCAAPAPGGPGRWPALLQSRQKGRVEHILCMCLHGSIRLPIKRFAG